MERKHLDFAVGAFVIAAFLSLTFIALKAANLAAVSGAGSYSVYVNFENIGSLKPRSPVKSAGVLVGRVRAIKLNTDAYEAEVEVSLFDEFRFPRDSIFSIVSSSLLGDHLIYINAGGDDKMLAEDAKLVGNSALILEELIGKLLFDKAAE